MSEIGRKQHADRASGPTSPLPGTLVPEAVQGIFDLSRRPTLYMVENRCALWRDLVNKSDKPGCLSHAIIQVQAQAQVQVPVHLYLGVGAFELDCVD